MSERKWRPIWMRRLLQMRHRIVLDCLGVRVGMQAGASRLFDQMLTEVARRRAEDFVVLANQLSASHFERLFTREHVIRLPVSGRSRAKRLLFQIVFYPFLIILFRPKLFITTSIMPMWGYRCRCLAFVFDLLPFHHPESFGRLELPLKRWLIKSCMHTAEGIVTISKWSAGDIRTTLGKRVRGQVHVVEPAGGDLDAIRVSEASQRRALQQLGLDGKPFILAVLGGRPYKNPGRLVQAFRQLVDQRDPVLALVIVGYAVDLLQGWVSPADIIVPGYVSDEILASLYQRAQALVFPTLFEGFGLPVLEANSLGLPVACSDLPVLHEVAGAAAVFFDPYSPDSIADAIWSVLTNPGLRRQLTERGLTNAKRYSWQKTAEQFLDICALETAVVANTANVR